MIACHHDLSYVRILMALQYRPLSLLLKLIANVSIKSMLYINGVHSYIIVIYANYFL